MIEYNYDDLDMKTEVVPLDRDTWREDDDPEKNWKIHLLCIRVERFSFRSRHENMIQENDGSWENVFFHGHVQYITQMDTKRSWLN